MQIPGKNLVNHKIYSLGKMFKKKQSPERIIYHPLSPDEKVALWKNHIENFSSEFNLTEEQANFCTHLLSALSPDIFISSANSSTFLATARYFETESYRLFSPQIRYYLLSSLQPRFENFIEENNINHQIKSGMIEDCACNNNDDWCLGLKVCRKTTDCTSSDSGCGFWWKNPCNGLCE